MIKLRARDKNEWTITENPKNNNFINKEEIVTTKKAIMKYWLSDDKKPVYPQKLWNLKKIKSRIESVTSEVKLRKKLNTKQRSRQLIKK